MAGRTVLNYLLGPAWQASGRDIEVRALDGYVAHIPAERFRANPAYLVFDSVDRAGGFVVDNLAQNEEGVPLGPYYLVWDSILHPELRADGAVDWPYQISEVNVSGDGAAALLPGRMASTYADEANSAQKYCLTCHKINGYGGSKWPIDLAQRAKEMQEIDFRRWVLTPSAIKPGTAMPPLPEELPEKTRQALAERLFAYLSAIPAEAR